jgi:hypothetical protein
MGLTQWQAQGTRQYERELPRIRESVGAHRSRNAFAAFNIGAHQSRWWASAWPQVVGSSTSEFMEPLDMYPLGRQSSQKRSLGPVERRAHDLEAQLTPLLGAPLIVCHLISSHPVPRSAS